MQIQTLEREKRELDQGVDIHWMAKIGENSDIRQHARRVLAGPGLPL